MRLGQGRRVTTRKLWPHPYIHVRAGYVCVLIGWFVLKMEAMTNVMDEVVYSRDFHYSLKDHRHPLFVTEKHFFYHLQKDDLGYLACVKDDKGQPLRSPRSVARLWPIVSQLTATWIIIIWVRLVHETDSWADDLASLLGTYNCLLDDVHICKWRMMEQSAWYNVAIHDESANLAIC